MRKLIALAIAFFFVFQSTAALATPVEHCCMEDCKAAACDVLTCSACVAPAAVNSRMAEVALDPEAVVLSRDEPAPSSAPQEIWRPPD